MGFRAIERVTVVHHNLVTELAEVWFYWVKQKGQELTDSNAPEHVSDVGELDELETFVGSKNKIW